VRKRAESAQKRMELWKRVWNEDLRSAIQAARPDPKYPCRGVKRPEARVNVGWTPPFALVRMTREELDAGTIPKSTQIDELGRSIRVFKGKAFDSFRSEYVARSFATSGPRHVDSDEIIFVTDHYLRPFVGGMPNQPVVGGFYPGEAKGIAYLWNHGSGRISCAAQVHAKSAEHISYTAERRGQIHNNNAEYQVQQDFEMQIYMRIYENMRLVQPTEP